MIRPQWPLFTAAVVLLPLSLGVARAQPYTLTTGAGSGDVTVGVDGFGTFGSFPGPNSTDATYQPVPPPVHAAVVTIYISSLALRIGGAGPRSFLSSGLVGGSGGLPNPVVSGSATSGTSSFVNSGLSFSLVQMIAPMFNGAARTGSILTQTYTITNTTGAPVTFELVRYLDTQRNVYFGGRFFAANGADVLYGDENPVNPLAVGITGVGGTAPAANRFEIKDYLLPPAPPPGPVVLDILAGTALNDAVAPGQPYNVTIGLRNVFTLAAGASTVYTAQTIWGDNQAVLVPTVGPPTPSGGGGGGGGGGPGGVGEGSYAGCDPPPSPAGEASFGFGASSLLTWPTAGGMLAGPYLDLQGAPKNPAPAGLAAAPPAGSRLRVFNVSGQLRGQGHGEQAASTTAGALGWAVLAALALAGAGALAKKV